MAIVTTPNGAQVDDTTGAVVKPAGSASTTTGGGDAFLDTLKSRLLASSGAVSSESTNLEKSISDAIAGVKSGNAASGAAIESKYNREIGYAADAGAQKMTSFQESTRGFATNTATLKQLQSDTDKNLKDLEQRKQELILQGDANAASQVAGLQMKAIEFRQQAAQQVFSNLLGMANFGVSVHGQEIQQSQFDQKMKFDTNAAMSDIALKYGLNVKPGETMESLYGRAAKDMGKDSPAALAIRQAKSEIDKNNAQIREISVQNKPLTGDNLDLLADAYNSGGAGVLAGLKDPTQQAAVIQRAGQREYNNAISQDKTKGTSKQDAKNKFLNNTALSASQKAAGISAVDKLYGPDSEQPAPKANVPNIFSWGDVIAQGSANFYGGIGEFFTGKDVKGIGFGN